MFVGASGRAPGRHLHVAQLDLNGLPVRIGDQLFQKLDGQSAGGLEIGGDAGERGARIGRAKDGKVSLAPGDYVLTREAEPTEERLALGRKADIPAFCAPQPDSPGDYRPWPLPLEERARALKARFRSRREVPLFDKPVRLQAKDFKTKGFFDARRTIDADALNAAFPKTAADGCLVVCGRGLTGRHEPVELAFTMSDGMVWGVNVTLPEHPSEVRVPLSALTHFRKWDLMSDPPKGTVPDGRDIVCVSIAIGGWLDEHAYALPHGMEVTSLRFDAVAAVEAEFGKIDIPDEGGRILGPHNCDM